MKNGKTHENSMHTSDAVTLGSCLSAAMPFLTSFLAASRSVYLALLSPDGTVRFVNPALAECLKVDCAVMVGLCFTAFLTEADRLSCAGRLAAKDTCAAEELLLNLVDFDQVPVTIRCRFASLEDGFLLLGEPLERSERGLQEELLQLNNQLSVLSRENVRKGKELARALEAAQAMHEQLDKAFWHLEKFQEVLPICMECGKVKSADSSWEDVVNFLKKNSMFLSHGYCPECADKLLAGLEHTGKRGVFIAKDDSKSD